MGVSFLGPVGALKEEGEDTNDHGEQSHTFDEGGNDDHARADVTGSLGLTGNGLHGASADFADTDTGGDCGDTCTESGAQLADRTGDTGSCLC